MSFSLLSFNARGLRNNLKRKAVFLYLKKFKSDFCLLQESHSTKDDLQFWKSQWANDLWGAHKSVKMAGVTVLKDYFGGKIIGHESDLEGHYIIFTVSILQKYIIFINLYGYNTYSENRNLFDILDDRICFWLNKYPNAYLIVGGDFNVVIDNKLDRIPPKDSKPHNSYLIDFAEKFDLYDIFRKKSPDLKCYTWSSKDFSKQSRLDFWLISKQITLADAEVNIHAAPLSDHKIITLNIVLSSAANIPRAICWKLNNSLLLHETVINNINRLITTRWEEATNHQSYSLYWELLKFDVSKYIRSYSSTLTKRRRAEEEDLCEKIALLSKKNINLTDIELIQLSECQNKLDDIYKRKAQGAFVRSRLRWMEEGEQCSSYFFSLEKSKIKKQTIDTLKIQDHTVNDNKIIASYCSEFYTKLYSSNFNEQYTFQVLNSIKSCKTISDSDKKHCDNPLMLTEVQEAIQKLKKNKSPGNDGLSGEFYKTFSTQLAPFLLSVYNESINKGTLPPTLTQGLTVLIPKPKKDLLLLDNWRPICLLNNDYKILANILANRIKGTLPSIIDEFQSGFMKKRHITNNIRLVYDLLDYSDLIHDNSFVLFLDFYKAFDTLEHEFIYQSLNKFGYGNFFTKAIQTLYSRSNSSIQLKYGTSPRFNVLRGVRQGCPISAYLFLLAAQLLSTSILESNVQGISIANREITISQVADDTTLFLKDVSQIPKAIEVIQKFSKASGLCLNLNKCELLSLKECNESVLYNIPVKSSVTYLGIVITKNTDEQCKLNFNPIIDKTKRRFNQWLQRDLSLNGRILLTKAEGISRLIYTALALHVDANTSKLIDKILYNFVWKNKTHYIKNSVITNSFDSGGLNFLDFTSLNYTFKINWLRNFLHSPESVWNFIPNFIFSKLGGLSFVLKCNYNIEKLPTKLSEYHKQMLLAWSMVYKHSFSPHTYLIWNNYNILFKNRSLFFQNWFNSNIMYVKQLFNSTGQLMNYSEFLCTYHIPVTPKEFAVVMDAIPSGVIMLFKDHSTTPFSYPSPVTETTIGKVCFSTYPNRNRKIRALFQKSIATVPYVTHHWKQFVDNIQWTKVWTLPYSFFITNKQREISYKLLHRCYPAKYNLRKVMDTTCTFCETEIETSVHLFWTCPYTVIFWKEFVNFVRCFLKHFILLYKDMLFGFYKIHNLEKKHYYIINLLLLLGKFHIHKSKVLKRKPLFKILKLEFQQYKETIQQSSKFKAKQTLDFIHFFGL